MNKLLAAAMLFAFSTPSYAQTTPPTTVAACLALLNEFGPKVATSGLPAADVAKIKAYGAAMAAHCNQSKFKEAAEAQGQIAAILAAKK